MRLITLRLGEGTTATRCGRCVFLDGEPGNPGMLIAPYARCSNRAIIDAGCLYGDLSGAATDGNAYVRWVSNANRSDACKDAERDHTQALHAARIDALESVGACDDMTGDRVLAEIKRLKGES